MESKKLCFLFFIIIILSVSCQTSRDTPVQTAVDTPKNEPSDQPAAEHPVIIEQPAAVAQPAKTEPPVVIEQPAAAAEIFNPQEITRQYYDSTMEDVKKFIDDLNKIINNKNYTAWKAVLSPEYFDEISSQENLQNISDMPAMKTRRIVLKTPEDYFIHVVVPARANSRVDDIEFLTRTRVKAFSINKNRQGEEQRLVLYDLEREGNSWIITN